MFQIFTSTEVPSSSFSISLFTVILLFIDCEFGGLKNKLKMIFHIMRMCGIEKCKKGRKLMLVSALSTKKKLKNTGGGHGH